MELFTQDWSSCFQGDVTTGEGVARLSCIWIVLGNVINASLVLAGVIAVFLIVYSGVQYITSGGDKEKVDHARKRLTYAIIGLIFIFMSFFFLSLISQFTGVGLDQLTTPPHAEPNVGLPQTPTP